MILGYHSVGKPTGLTDLAQTTGMARTTISGNNAFLSFIGVLEGANKKSLTEVGGRLARAVEHDIILEVQKVWSEIISENEFLTKMIQAVKIRRGMEYSQLENHIAFSSGESKSASVMTGSRAVIDIFLSAGALIQEGEKLVVNEHIPGISDHASPELIKDKDDIAIDPVFHEPSNDVPHDAERKTIYDNSQIKIELTISAKPDELDGLGKKIRAIIDDINQ